MMMETFKSTEFIDGLVSFSVVCSLSLKPGLVCYVVHLVGGGGAHHSSICYSPLKHREIRTPREKKNERYL